MPMISVIGTCVLLSIMCFCAYGWWWKRTHRSYEGEEKVTALIHKHRETQQVANAMKDDIQRQIDTLPRASQQYIADNVISIQGKKYNLN